MLLKSMDVFPYDGYLKEEMAQEIGAEAEESPDEVVVDRLR